jgi:hypothetical protein
MLGSHKQGGTIPFLPVRTKIHFEKKAQCDPWLLNNIIYFSHINQRNLIFFKVWIYLLGANIDSCRGLYYKTFYGRNLRVFVMS